jgi:hypothetical protein
MGNCIVVDPQVVVDLLLAFAIWPGGPLVIGCVLNGEDRCGVHEDHVPDVVLVDGPADQRGPECALRFHVSRIEHDDSVPDVHAPKHAVRCTADATAHLYDRAPDGGMCALRNGAPKDQRHLQDSATGCDFHCGHTPRIEHYESLAVSTSQSPGSL